MPSRIIAQGSNTNGTLTSVAIDTAATIDTTLDLPSTSGKLINTAPGTTGNVLTSDGTNWVSQTPSAAGISPFLLMGA